MKVSRLLLLGVLLALVVTGCGLTTETPSVGADLPQDVEIAVKEVLSARTGVAVDEIEVVDAEEREWPDACLGLAQEGEACAEVITPGWQVTLRAGGAEYVFRTDEDGSAIRMEE